MGNIILTLSTKRHKQEFELVFDKEEKIQFANITLDVLVSKNMVSIQRPKWSFHNFTKVALTNAILHIDNTSAEVSLPHILCIPGRNDAFTNKSVYDMFRARGLRVIVLYYANGSSISIKRTYAPSSQSGIDS